MAKDWFKQNSDKLILVTLVVFFTLIGLHMFHDHSDQADVNWVTGLVSSAVGALLILITGQKKSDADSK